MVFRLTSWTYIIASPTIEIREYLVNDCTKAAVIRGFEAPQHDLHTDRGIYRGIEVMEQEAMPLMLELC